MTLDMVEDAVDDVWVVDAGVDPDGARTHLAAFDIDVEHAFEALCPSHRATTPGRGTRVSTR